MTDATDGPVQRAAIALRKEFNFAEVMSFRIYISDANALSLARIMLLAALKVRWEGNQAYIGPLPVGNYGHFPGMTEPYSGWRLDKNEDGEVDVGEFATLAEAKAAVERAVVEAILGKTP